MAIEIRSAKRRFLFNDKELVDPGQEMTTDEVLSFYGEAYPELTNGSVSASELDEDGETMTYILNSHVGDKG